MNIRNLEEHPFLKPLTDEQLQRVSACAADVRFGPGDFIFRAGEAADRLFLIRSGRVALLENIPGQGAVQVEMVGPGDLLGLSWFTTPARWTLDARATEAVEAFSLGAKCVRELFGDAELGRRLAMQLVDALYDRLQRVRLQRLDIYGGAPR